MDIEKEYGVRNTKNTIHRPTKKEYGVHVTNRTVYYLINFIVRRKKEYRVYIINRTV